MAWRIGLVRHIRVKLMQQNRLAHVLDGDHVSFDQVSQIVRPLYQVLNDIHNSPPMQEPRDHPQTRNRRTR